MWEGVIWKFGMCEMEVCYVGGCDMEVWYVGGCDMDLGSVVCGRV